MTVAGFDPAVVEHLVITALAQGQHAHARLLREAERRVRVLVVAHVIELRDGRVVSGVAGAHERPDVGGIQAPAGREDAHTPVPRLGGRRAIPVVVGVRAVALVVHEIVAACEMHRPIEQPVLRGAAGMLGVLVAHRPDTLVLFFIHDPGVVRHAVAEALADRIDVHVHRTPQREPRRSHLVIPDADQGNDGLAVRHRLVLERTDRRAGRRVGHAQRETPELGIGRGYVVPIVRAVRVVAGKVRDVVSQLELQRLVRHAILGRTAGGIGRRVVHRPDALVRVDVDDPAVVEFLIYRQLTDGVHLDGGGPRDLEPFARGAVAVRDDRRDGRRGEGRTRGGDVLRGCAAPCAADGERELPVESALDVGAAVLGAPAEPDDVLQIEVEIAVERDGGCRIGRVMRFVGAGGEVDGAREPAQAVGVAPRVHRADIPHDGARPRVENPGRRRPRRLLVVLPVLVVARTQPVRPRLRTDGGDLKVLGCGQNEDAYAVFPGRQVLNVHQLCLSQNEQQDEMHG